MPRGYIASVDRMPSLHCRVAGTWRMHRPYFARKRLTECGACGSYIQLGTLVIKRGGGLAPIVFRCRWCTPMHYASDVDLHVGCTLCDGMRRRRPEYLILPNPDTRIVDTAYLSPGFTKP